MLVQVEFALFDQLHHRRDREKVQVPTGSVGVPGVIGNMLGVVQKWMRAHGHDVPNSHVFAMTGDGEWMEEYFQGSLSIPGEHEVQNNTHIVNVNGMRLVGLTGDQQLELMKRIYEAHGWHVEHPKQHQHRLFHVMRKNYCTKLHSDLQWSHSLVRTHLIVENRFVSVDLLGSYLRPELESQQLLVYSSKERPKQDRRQLFQHDKNKHCYKMLRLVQQWFRNLVHTHLSLVRKCVFVVPKGIDHSDQVQDLDSDLAQGLGGQCPSGQQKRIFSPNLNVCAPDCGTIAGPSATSYSNACSYHAGKVDAGLAWDVPYYCKQAVAATPTPVGGSCPTGQQRRIYSPQLNVCAPDCGSIAGPNATSYNNSCASHGKVDAGVAWDVPHASHALRKFSSSIPIVDHLSIQPNAYH
jgi:hypothetical protein